MAERLDARAARSAARDARRLVADRGEDGVVAGRATVTIATLAWFLAAARTIDGPPMSISSTSSSSVIPGRSAAAANG